MNDKLRRIEEELAKLHNPEEMEVSKSAPIIKRSSRDVHSLKEN